MAHNSQLTAVFMGSDMFSLPVLEMLLAGGPTLPLPVEVIGVVTQPDRPAGRGRKLVAGPVKEAALDHRLVVLQPERLEEPAALESVLALSPDLIVVASFGQILPRALLEAPRYRCLNLHPSLLPRYRGASPVESAILDGADETGTSLMLMVQKMDAGPVLRQERLTISPAETAGELTARLAALSAELLLATLPGWVRGDIIPHDQDEREATYTVRITKHEGRVDWSWAAEAIARRVRAFNPWPVAHTVWSGRPLRLLRAHAREGSAPPGHVVGVEEGGLVIGTGSGLLIVEEMQLAGGRPAPAAALVRGHPRLLGADLASEASWSSG